MKIFAFILAFFLVVSRLFSAPTVVTGLISEDAANSNKVPLGNNTWASTNGWGTGGGSGSGGVQTNDLYTVLTGYPYLTTNAGNGLYLGLTVGANATNALNTRVGANETSITALNTATNALNTRVGTAETAITALNTATNVLNGRTNYVDLAASSERVSVSNVALSELAVRDSGGNVLLKISGVNYDRVNLGYNNTVGASGVVIGQGSTANDGPTIGFQASGGAASAVIGWKAQGGDGVVAIGESATADGDTAFSGNIAIGSGDVVTAADAPAKVLAGIGNVALGKRSLVEAGTNNTALGFGAEVQGALANTMQLGLGTNSTTGTLQFRTFQIIDASGIVPVARYNANVGTNVTVTGPGSVSYDSGTRTWAVVVSNQAGGGGVTFQRLAHAFRGTDLVPYAVSNFWGKVETKLDATVIASAAGFGTAYSNSVQRGVLIGHIPVDALRTNVDATFLQIDYFLFGNNTNTFCDCKLYAQQTNTANVVTNSLLVYTNANMFGAVAVGAYTNYIVPTSALFSTNLLEHVLYLTCQSQASHPLTNNGVVFIGGKKGF